MYRSALLRKVYAAAAGILSLAGVALWSMGFSILFASFVVAALAFVALGVLVSTGAENAPTTQRERVLRVNRVLAVPIAPELRSNERSRTVALEPPDPRLEAVRAQAEKFDRTWLSNATRP